MKVKLITVEFYLLGDNAVAQAMKICGERRYSSTILDLELY
jgi:hypothetical protein